MRHLLTHVGGWDGDYFEDTGNGDDALDRYVKLLSDLPQLTRLGTVFSYNNSVFAIAGRVIEVVTGQTYENALKGIGAETVGTEPVILLPDGRDAARLCCRPRGLRGSEFRLASLAVDARERGARRNRSIDEGSASLRAVPSGRRHR